MPASVSRAAIRDRDAQEYQEGTRAARKARENVARDIGHLLKAFELTGSKPLLLRRLREVSVADQDGDPMALRAALVDLGAAAGAWAAQVELSAPAAFTER